MEAIKTLLAQGLREMGLTPPEGAVDKLCRYGELLLEQNQVMNLTAITDPAGVAQLHFLDSAAVLTHAGVSLAGKSVVDVGTGAGFPGMVLKILEPSLTLTLADSLGKRVRWLEEICEDLSLDGVQCLHARAEEQALAKGFRDSFDFAAARAVADLRVLCELCLPLVKVGGRMLAMKSANSEEEINVAKRAVKLLGGQVEWVKDYRIPSTEITHRVVCVRKVSAAPEKYPRRFALIKKQPL